MTDGAPWAVKEVRFNATGGETTDDWLTVEVFADSFWGIYAGSKNDESGRFFIEDMPLESARILRDFLIYALGDDKDEIDVLARIDRLFAESALDGKKPQA